MTLIAWVAIGVLILCTAALAAIQLHSCVRLLLDRCVDCDARVLHLKPVPVCRRHLPEHRR